MIKICIIISILIIQKLYIYDITNSTTGYNETIIFPIQSPIGFCDLCVFPEQKKLRLKHVLFVFFVLVFITKTVFKNCKQIDP